MDYRARFPDCRGHSVRDRFEVVTEMANIGTWESELRRNRITGPPQLEAFHDFQPGTQSEWARMSRFRTNQDMLTYFRSPAAPRA